MPKPKRTQDIDTSVRRFLAANRRVAAGIVKQHQRIVSREKDLPRLLAGTPEEVIDSTGAFQNDVDYCIYEVGRLRVLVKTEALVVFSHPPELVDAVSRFEEAIPRLQSIRNSLTHFDDTDRLDRFATFAAAVDILPSGDVEYLVDPRHNHHDAALALSQALFDYLRPILRQSIADDPPPPIDEQIKLRNGHQAP
jgi:hypothetical protein